MVVIVIIGILATLAYSSLIDVIFANRAKETAQTIRTFTERSLMDAKRQNKQVRISISGNAITAADIGANGATISSEALSQGFSPAADSPVEGLGDDCFKNTVETQIRIGLSGIDKEGYFAACGFKGYCGGAVKLANENSLKAYVKKGTGKQWEAL
ncbi:hypothetical protein R83H12_01516 [Fibrobacteria bacterium R8-3-H12]